MKKIILGLIVLAILSCSQNSKTSVLKSNFEWLCGTWQAKQDSMLYIEKWQIKNDTELTGFAFMLQKSDTIFSEKLRIVERDSQFVFIAKVPDQNNGTSVEFKLTNKEKMNHIFENPLHDYPTRIIYKFSKPDSLHASVEGVVNDTLRSEVFLMKKINSK